MAQRKLSTKKYVLALILTIIIFLGGIVAGVMLEDARLKDTKQITLSEKVNLRSLQLQKEYIDLGIAECNALNHILEANINELAKKIAIIIDYEKTLVHEMSKISSIDIDDEEDFKICESLVNFNLID